MVAYRFPLANPPQLRQAAGVARQMDIDVTKCPDDEVGMKFYGEVPNDLDISIAPVQYEYGPQMMETQQAGNQTEQLALDHAPTGRHTIIAEDGESEG
jgi:hypothetical protein